MKLVGDAIGVTPSVRDQMTFVYKVLGTQVTMIGPIHGHALLMTPLMEHEVSLETECLPTVRAYIRTISGMRPEMFEEAGLVIEWFSANDTIELRAREMLTQMTLQMFLAGECTITEFTRVWGFTCMNADMTS